MTGSEDRDGDPMPSHAELPDGPLRLLTTQVHSLYRAAGMPGVRAISDGIKGRDDLPDTVSHEAVRGILIGKGARWSKVDCVVRYLAELAHQDPDGASGEAIQSWLASQDIDSLEPDSESEVTAGSQRPVRYESGNAPPPAASAHEGSKIEQRFLAALYSIEQGGRTLPGADVVADTVGLDGSRWDRIRAVTQPLRQEGLIDGPAAFGAGLIRVRLTAAGRHAVESGPVLRFTGPLLSNSLHDRIVADREQERQLLAAIATTPNWQHVADALRLATDLRLISTFGVRVPLGFRSLYSHFAARNDSDTDAIKVQIQDLQCSPIDGTNVSWEKGTPPEEMLYELGRRLRRTHYWPGDRGYNPVGIFSRLAGVLKCAHDALSHGSHEWMTEIFEIIDDDWVVTGSALAHGDPSYGIEYSRLKESDWRKHMQEKEWVDFQAFDRAYAIATALIERGEVRPRRPIE